jgi:hypothetical protein
VLQDGIYRQFSGSKVPSNANFKRLNIRSNLDFEATKTTTVSLDLNSRLEAQQNVSTDDINSNSVFAQMNITPPYLYAYLLPNGSYGGSATTSAVNMMSLLKDYGNNRLFDNTMEGTFKINQKLDFFTKGLSIRGMVSFNSVFNSGTKVGYWPPTFTYSEDGTYTKVTDETSPWINKLDGDGVSRRTNMEYSINYSRSFEKHDITGMLLYTQTKTTSNAAMPQGFLGYVGRATYAFNHKYLTEFNFGYNGSENFENGHRFGFFPSVALGWRISEEPFMQGLRKTY